LKALETKHFRLLELSGHIIHLDEVLTMSARMAAFTGQQRWERRYRNFEPQLDAAIKEVIELSPEEFMSEAITQTDIANVKLVAMENEAFDLVRNGELQAAVELLHSQDYEREKLTYSEGITEIADAIRSREQARLDNEQRIALTTIVLLIATMPLVAFMWLAALRMLKRYVVERRQTEHALRVSEQCFSAIADYSYFWEIWVSPQGRPIWTNPAVQRVTGYSTEELMAMPDYPTPLIGEQDRRRMGKAFELALKGGIGNEVQFRLLRKDGTAIWAEGSWKPIYGQEGAFIGYRASIRDISERKRTLDTLKITQFCLDHAADAIFWIEPEARFVYVNDAACRALEYSRQELLSMTVHDIDPNFPKEVWPEHWEQVRRRGSFTFESNHRTKTGRIFPAEITINYINYKGKEYNCAFARDITDRRKAEQSHYRLNKELEEKNKELESILYAASHDLKSPLVNIQGFGHELSQSCELIRSALAETRKSTKMDKAVGVALNKDIPNALDFILTSTAKMDSLLSGLLDLCRLNTAEMKTEPIDMNAMMTDIAASIEYQIEQAAAKVDTEPLPRCLGDVSQINRVFTNLLTNALKFLGESRPGQIRIYGTSQGDQSVYCVEDNGIGIAPEHQQNIFEMFYQLEPEKREGEGIGLTIVRRIVDRHSGRTWVESKVGEGTKFFVSLPHA
jgi:PAS domain S-box-containing protein